MRVAVVMYCIATAVFLFSLTFHSEREEEARRSMLPGKPKLPKFAARNDVRKTGTYR